MRKKLPLIILFLMFSIHLYSQTSSQRPGRRSDSITEPYTYKYIFPILGQGAANKGFVLPMPHGVMLNFLPMRQFIQLSNMQVGFNNSGLIDIDEIVQFEPTKVTGSTTNLRFDTWILPFLNVYGMYGTINSNTVVQLAKPIDLRVEVPLNGTYASIGAMVAGGFKNLFFSGDFNHSWTFNDKLDKPAKVVVSGLRMGPIFRLNKEESNLVFWGGLMYTHLASQTNGSIPVNEVFPNVTESVDEMKMDLEDWYNDLPPAKQVLYKPLYEKLENGLDDLKNFGDEGTIEYAMQKSIDKPWNLTIGGQWQINYRWQFRVEGQFLGDRQGALISLNYRFGIPGKNLFYKGN